MKVNTLQAGVLKYTEETPKNVVRIKWHDHCCERVLDEVENRFKRWCLCHKKDWQIACEISKLGLV